MVSLDFLFILCWLVWFLFNFINCLFGLSLDFISTSCLIVCVVTFAVFLVYSFLMNVFEVVLAPFPSLDVCQFLTSRCIYGLLRLSLWLLFFIFRTSFFLPFWGHLKYGAWGLWSVFDARLCLLILIISFCALFGKVPFFKFNEFFVGGRVGSADSVYDFVHFCHP